MKLPSFVFIVALCLCLVRTAESVLPPADIQVPDFQTYRFSGAVPAEFAGGEHSELSISDKHYHQDPTGGDRTSSSLRWDWDAPGASFTFTHPEAFKHLTGESPDPVVYAACVTMCTLSAMQLWVYNEKPQPEPLGFEIGDGKTVDSRFWMNLNFTGWRELKFLYGRDLDNFPNQQTANTLRVVAPARANKGTLYFSHFCPRKEVDVRFGPTEQTPWVGCRLGRRVSAAFANPALAKPWNPKELPGLSPDQTGFLKTLGDRYLEEGYGGKISPRRVKPEEVEKLRADIVERHHITRSGNAVNGIVVGPREYFGSLGSVANLYGAAQNQPDVQKDLLGLYIDLVDLLASGRGNLDSGYGGLNEYWVRPTYLMREPLRRVGKWEAALHVIPSCVEMDGIAGDVIPPANADQFYAALKPRLAMIFLWDDPARQWAALKLYQRHLEYCADNGCIQSDGVFMHHSMIYTGYMLPGMGALSYVLPWLHGTPFECSKMEARARQIGRDFAFISCGVEMPHFLSGRWRNAAGVDPAIFARLARLGDPQTGEPIDREMAGYFLHFSELQKKPRNAAADSFTEAGIRPLTPQGHLSLNYACGGIQRRGQWMAFVRGQKRGISANEAYPYNIANTNGRYLNYGQIVVHSKGSPVNEKASGMDFGIEKDFAAGGTGWNWSLWPGTTSLLLPHDLLRSRFGVEESITSEPFCGDTFLEDNGVWGMKLQEEIPGAIDPERTGPPRYWLGEKRYGELIREGHYDAGFRARKSVFMFENRLICLGSGIASTEKDYPAVTTLFQNILKPENKKFILNGNADVGYPMQTDQDTSAAPVWFINATDNGFYIPKGNGSVCIQRKWQKLPFYPYWNPSEPSKHNLIVPNEGETEIAYFNHGITPADGHYEYAMLIDTNRNEMSRFAGEMTGVRPPYRVFERDASAHVVRDRDSGMTGYVIFDSEWKPSFAGADVVRVSAPCLLLFKNAGKGRLKMSFCNPDLGGHYMTNGAANEVEQVASVTLNGHWRLAVNSPQVSAISETAATHLTFKTHGAIPAVVELLAEP